MATDEDHLPEVYIQPGESCLVREPAILRTILGSCVGVTFWSPRHSAAALCHPMLPACPDDLDLGSRRSMGRRYVDFTIREVAQQLDALGAPRKDVEVKLFGGANVLAMENRSSRPTVGAQNMKMALRILRDEGFTVSTSSMGGDAGIKIHFNTRTGEVLLHRLR